MLSVYIVMLILHMTLIQKKWTLVTLAIIVIELSLNSFFMTQGILADWNYPSRSLYSEPYKKQLKV